MKHVVKKLKQKKWSDEDLEKIQRTIERGEFKKKITKKIWDRLIYWIALTVVVLGNFFLLISIIPALLLFEEFYSILLISLLGLCFGTITEYILCGLNTIEKKHHLKTAILLPLITFTSTIIITMKANSFIESMNVSANQHNYLVIGIVYTISVLTPFIIHKILNQKLYK